MRPEFEEEFEYELGEFAASPEADWAREYLMYTRPGRLPGPPLGDFDAPPPRCAAADLDVFLLNAILNRLRSRPRDPKLLDLLKRAVESTLKALPNFVEQGCCEPHLKSLEADIQGMPWLVVGQGALRKQLVDAIRAAQQLAKKDFKHC
jgi:hypothetical protein